MAKKQTFRVVIGRVKIDVCPTCYQRLRREGKIRVRPYVKHKHANRQGEEPQGPQTPAESPEQADSQEGGTGNVDKGT